MIIILGITTQCFSFSSNLMQAINDGNLDSVKKIIAENSSELNATDKQKSTVLMFAVYKGEPEIVSYLIEMGADISLENSKNQTALDIVMSEIEQLSAGTDFEKQITSIFDEYKYISNKETTLNDLQKLKSLVEKNANSWATATLVDYIKVMELLLKK
ncbi:ankyrin repeat domain-containing protein [Candidatus Dependentiae bacterium]|nr:ankyrin repeat domain-containing protein [Candidatus Dependentiae bacterium]MBU4386881.1 ankyrin repeat domain-containing protein [Candidatus Dependentiae bacterium]MCG2755968.1 ankyrin repeat domain-containing protein [Candidatus Dependentiae bacterium]